LLLGDVVPFGAGRLVFLPFTQGPRGFVLSWSTINAFAAASLGVSEKRLMEFAMPMLHSLRITRALTSCLPAMCRFWASRTSGLHLLASLPADLSAETK